MSIFTILLALHLIAMAFVVGGVFMNVVIVWPTARETLGKAGFPLEFLAVEGRRIAPWIYFGLTLILISGVGLAFLKRPSDPLSLTLVATKIVLFFVMLGNTLYGTISTWPALQFSHRTEVIDLWTGYVWRARVTLACGVAAIIVSVLQRWYS